MKTPSDTQIFRARRALAKARTEMAAARENVLAVQDAAIAAWRPTRTFGRAFAASSHPDLVATRNRYEDLDDRCCRLAETAHRLTVSEQNRGWADLD